MTLAPPYLGWMLLAVTPLCLVLVTRMQIQLNAAQTRTTSHGVTATEAERGGGGGEQHSGDYMSVMLHPLHF